MQFSIAPKTRRKPSLTPMIDVVFLLLVFFMLASQFGLDQVLKLPLAGANAAAKYTGPPRLVTVGKETVSLNGTAVSLDMLSARLTELVEKNTDPIIVRGHEQANAQDVLNVLARLKDSGFETVVLVE